MRHAGLLRKSPKEEVRPQWVFLRLMELLYTQISFRICCLTGEQRQSSRTLQDLKKSQRSPNEQLSLSFSRGFLSSPFLSLLCRCCCRCCFYRGCRCCCWHQNITVSCRTSSRCPLIWSTRRWAWWSTHWTTRRKSSGTSSPSSTQAPWPTRSQACLRISCSCASGTLTTWMTTGACRACSVTPSTASGKWSRCALLHANTLACNFRIIGFLKIIRVYLS